MGKILINTEYKSLEEINNFIQLKLLKIYKSKFTGSDNNILLLKKGNIQVRIKWNKDVERYSAHVSSSWLIPQIFIVIIGGIIAPIGIIPAFVAVLSVGYVTLGVLNIINRKKIKMVEDEITGILIRNI